MLQGFDDVGEVWIVMNVQDGWPESVYTDEESAEEAVRQLQEIAEDDFFKIVYSGLDRFVKKIEDDEKDEWI